MATFTHAFGTSELERRPVSKGDLLFAWDAADTLLLDALAESGVPAGSRVLVVNDAFGALATALTGYSTVSWSDSRTSHLSTELNIAANGASPVVLVPATEPPGSGFDAVLWRIPRMMDQLRWQARELHRSLGVGCRIWAAGMDKHLPDRAVDVLGQMGAVALIPGRKKAHSFAITTDEGAGPSVPPAAGFSDKGFALDFVASPMVFGAGKLDIGTKLLAERFDHLPDADRIADLGCGTGVLGLVAQRMLSSAEVDFIDESYLAVAATEANYRANIGDPANTGARFIAADVLEANPAGLYDLVLCNPPFHQGHVVGDGVAWQMFTSAREQLRIGGQLWIVGNRHLEYHNKLARLFSHVRQLASDPRFVVLAGTRGVMPFVKPPKRKKSKSPRPRPTAG